MPDGNSDGSINGGNNGDRSGDIDNGGNSNGGGHRQQSTKVNLMLYIKPSNSALDRPLRKRFHVSDWPDP